MGKLFGSVVAELRLHPVDKWVRALAGDDTVVSSKRAKLVWEPRRVLPSYAVPVSDVHGDLVPYAGDSGQEKPVRMGQDGPPVLDPETPFRVHTCPGASLTIRGPYGELPGAAFAPQDESLDGYVVVDWEAFSQWYEEGEQVIGHPHDPFDRIDCLRSSRHIVVSLNGQVLADTSHATLLFETPLPTRYYLPRDDVRMDLLVPSEVRDRLRIQGGCVIPDGAPTTRPCRTSPGPTKSRFTTPCRYAAWSASSPNASTSPSTSAQTGRPARGHRSWTYDGGPLVTAAYIRAWAVTASVPPRYRPRVGLSLHPMPRP